MNIETITKKGDTFKLSFVQKIKSYIEEKIKNGETKIILSEDYINEILNVQYTTDNLYIKMRNMLLGTNLGVSIKRKNREFVFYQISDNIGRESDLFKITFETKLKPYLLEIFKTKHIIGFEENFLKELLDINYSTTYIYNNFKNILLDTNITVSTEKNKIIKGKRINEFIFCDNDKKKEIIKNNNEIEKNKNEEINNEDEKEFMNYLKESEKFDKEQNLRRREKIVNEGAEFMKNYIIPDVEMYKCPLCDDGILKFPDITCPNCKSKVLEKWK